ncbi:MAG TPA: tetratricopeptide repeat protein, partial [Candidatus Polarisedimenticolia bacterium]|nr:tetratricopeptide repeat protein [Candidatus Polarisedimenticolia bacterium]
FFYGGIFYPYLLACFLLFSGSLYPICLAQHLAGCALAWTLYRLAGLGAGREASASAVGLLAAGLALFYGPLAFLEADILMISWALLAMMAGACLLLAGIGAHARGRVFGLLASAGVCLAVAASDRPNLLALLPAAALWAALISPRGVRVPRAGAVLAGGAAVLLVMVGLNRAASGRWVLTTTSAGINFYIGNHPGARGTFDEPWSASDTEFTARHTDLEHSSLVMASRRLGRDVDPVEASGFWLQTGLDYLRSDPLRAARLYLRKLLLFWSSAEVPNHLNFSFIRSQAPALWLMPLGFWLVAPLGLYGLFAPQARPFLSPEARWLLRILVFVPMLTVLPFFIADRYRIPVVPPLCLAAACGFSSLVRGLRDPLGRRSACVGLACVALGGLAITRPLVEFDISRDEWLMAQAYRKAGDYRLAAQGYERAVAASPDDAILRNNLGVVYGLAGDDDSAMAAYRKSIEMDGALTLPRRNLGLLLLKKGEALEALEHLEKAEASDPDDIDVARALAAIYQAAARPDEARTRALKVLAAKPDDLTALGILRAQGEIRAP